MINSIDPTAFDPTTAKAIPESVQYALDKLKSLCDEPTFSALEPLALIAPNIILALVSLIDIDEAILEGATHNYGAQLMKQWVTNLADSAIHGLGCRPIMDEETFNAKYGGHDANKS